ncbi:unnamed protein product [Malus baccata var. baccata]
MAFYWNVMFDDDKSKGVANVDNNFEATPLSEPKRKAKTGDHVHMGALPSSSRLVTLVLFLNGYQFRWSYDMKSLFFICRSMSLATEVERLRSNAVVKSFDRPLTPNKLSPRGKEIIEVTTITVNLPTFDVDLLKIIEAQNANDVAQSQLHILEFRVEGELGERQVFHLREEDEDMEVNKYINHTEKAIDVNEATGPSDLEPFHGKGMLLKHKVIQLVHPFTLIESYKRKKVGDGHSTKDFFALDPLWIIPNPDVEVFIDVLMR